jgi:hypothetical protein
MAFGAVRCFTGIVFDIGAPVDGEPKKAVVGPKGPHVVRILAIATALSLTAFLAHWLLWRVRIPARQTAALLAIFSTTLVLGLVSSAWWPPAWRLTSAWEVLHVAIFHVAAMLAYVVAYSALEERSPSMTILSRVADSGSRGQSREELQAMLVNVSPVEIRLAAMVRDGMVRDEAEMIVLTNKGWAWANTFTTWRRLLRFRLGG